MDKIWDVLGKKLPLLFGRECARASIWMFCVLSLRLILNIFRLDTYMPNGFIFGLPLVIQVIGKYIPLMADCFPLLPIRLAESILGRISPSRLTVIIPAHFLGCILGAVFFGTIFPYAPVVIFQPVIYSVNQWFYGLIVEIIVVCLYTIIIIALPQLLLVNKLPLYLLSIPIVPLMLIGVPDGGSAFNPAAMYALWYVGGNSNKILQQEHLIAPILGSVFAGLICSRFFPDDSGSWRRK